MQAPDRMRITFSQNPACAEAFRDAKPGDKVSFECRATVKAMDAEGIDFIVEAVVPEGYEIDDTKEEVEQPPMMSESTMTPSAMMVRRKQMSGS